MNYTGGQERDGYINIFLVHKDVSGTILSFLQRTVEVLQMTEYHIKNVRLSDFQLDLDKSKSQRKMQLA